MTDLQAHFVIKHSPVLKSPPEPASRNLRLLGACENAYFATSFKLVGLMAFPSELTQLREAFKNVLADFVR